MAQTSRWGLHYPEGTDAPDVPKWMKDLALDLDDVAKDDQGTLAERPTSTAESPGQAGRYYYATDNGTLYRDTGTSWVAVNPTAANQVAEGSIADEAVTSRKFKPSAGLVQASSNLTLTSSFQDVPGATLEITPAVASVLLVTTFADLEETGPSATTSLARPLSTLNVDGSDQTRQGIVEAGWAGASTSFSAVVRGVATQGYALNLTAAAHTIKLRAKRQGASGTCYAAGSGFHYMLLAD